MVCYIASADVPLLAVIEIYSFQQQITEHRTLTSCRNHGSVWQRTDPALLMCSTTSRGGCAATTCGRTTGGRPQQR